MQVNAKFSCQSVTTFASGDKEVKLSPVTGKGNEDFSRYTPSGECRMLISKETKAADLFVPGKTYDLTFTESK